jgi:two-component system, OmpR family, phosphate regulon sensor histidine kinase PhoR
VALSSNVAWPSGDPPPPLPRPAPADYLDLLAHYGRELSLTLEIPRIYELALDGALALSGAPAGMLCARPPGADEWRVLLARGLDPALATAIGRAAVTEGGSAVITMSFIVVDGRPKPVVPWRDVRPLLPPAAANALAALRLEQLLSLPFEQEGPAALHLLGRRTVQVSPESLDAVRMLLGQASVALRNARLYFEGARWAARLAMLQATATEIGATLQLSSVLASAARRAAELVAARSGVLALWSLPDRVLQVETRWPDGAALDTGERAELGEGLAGAAAQERKVARQDPAPADGAPAAALVAVPLLWQDDLLGVLEVGDDRSGRAFSDEDVALLTLLGQHIAGAIANARLYERAQTRLHQLTVLQDTSRAIIAQLDYDQVLRTVLSNASSLLGARMGAVFVPDERREALAIRVAVGLSDHYTRTIRVARGEGCVGRVVAAAKPMAVSDIETDPAMRGLREGPVAPEFRSILAVPLIHQGQVLGALCVYGSEPRHWSPLDAELLLVFASQAANAMQNVVLFDRLRAEKATLATTIQSMSDGLIATDANGAIILANPVAERMFNVPFSAHMGQNLEAALAASPYSVRRRSGDLAPGWAQVVLRDGAALRGELDVRGTTRAALEFSFLAVIGAGHTITGGLAVFHDITELRRLNDLKTDFISMVSHELRTPLTSIKGFVKLVLVEDLGPLTPQQRECLTIADSEADRLTQLIDDLLDTSRIDAGKMTFTWEELDLRELVEQVLHTMRPQIADQQLTVEASLPAQAPAVRGDRQRLIQILTNLVGNALKFTPPGGRVAITGAVAPGHLVVSVADTGVGIPPDALEHVFERFYQVDRGEQADAPYSSGAGLGLAITRQLVELHGGRIWAQSAPGAGATFTFTLPIA